MIPRLHQLILGCIYLRTLNTKSVNKAGNVLGIDSIKVEFPIQGKTGLNLISDGETYYVPIPFEIHEEGQIVPKDHTVVEFFPACYSDVTNGDDETIVIGTSLIQELNKTSRCFIYMNVTDDTFMFVFEEKPENLPCEELSFYGVTSLGVENVLLDAGTLETVEIRKAYLVKSNEYDNEKAISGADYLSTIHHLYSRAINLDNEDILYHFREDISRKTGQEIAELLGTFINFNRLQPTFSLVKAVVHSTVGYAGLNFPGTLSIAKEGMPIKCYNIAPMGNKLLGEVEHKNLTAVFSEAVTITNALKLIDTNSLDVYEWGTQGVVRLGCILANNTGKGEHLCKVVLHPDDHEEASRNTNFVFSPEEGIDVSNKINDLKILLKYSIPKFEELVGIKAEIVEV